MTSVTTPNPGGLGGSPQITTTLYDNMMRPYSVIQPDGTTVSSDYLLTGELGLQYGSRTYPVGYGYDYAGRLQTMTNWSNFGGGSSGGARVTTWNYDGNRGWLTNKTYDGGAAGPGYTYTYAGRLASRAWARGITTSYGYDNGGSLTNVSYDDGVTPSVTTVYDRLGRPNQIGGTSSTESLTYNLANQIITDTQNGLSVTNGYDSDLRRTTLAALQSNNPLIQQSFGFDAASRLQTVSTLDSGLGTSDSATYSYVANSPLVGQIVFAQNGATRMTTTKSYDNLNRLTFVGSTPATGVGSGAPPLPSFGYQYNSANQRTRADVGGASSTSPTYWLYTYDSLGQVTSGKKYWSDGTPVAGQQFEYAFDTIGNRTSTKAGGDANGANLRQAGYTPNNLNQITSRDVPGYIDIMGVSFATNTVTVNSNTAYRKVEYFRKELGVNNSSLALWTNIIVAANGQTSVTGNVLLAKSPQVFAYDVDGNLTSDDLWTNTWDAENRLIATENLTNVSASARMKEEWTYLPDGRWNQRIISTWNTNTLNYEPSTTNYFVWDGKVLLAILDQTNGLVMSFMHGLDLSGSMQGAGGVGGLLAVSFKTNGTHFAAFDGNGNVAALVSATDGTSSANYEYDPFGQTIRITGAVGKLNPIRFSTQFADDVTGRIKYLHREYTPSTGTWPISDPLGEPGFEVLRGRPASRSAGEPNRYLFIANNPANKFDLLGLFGDGGGGPGTDDSGHADFNNVSKCPFDFTAEDRGFTSPWPGIGSPWNHFQNLPDSESKLQNAVNSCDSGGFQSAMHQAQDFYSHFNKGYRWDPGNKALPCDGWGHACDGTAPDHDAAAWNAANATTARWLNAWRGNCCLRCKAHWWQRSCKWIKRSSGSCAPDSP